MEENLSNFFKVWDVYRQKKVFVVAKGSTNIYEQVVLKASEKLNINGVALVLENDGTQITEDEELLFVKLQPVILLEKDQFWKPEATSDAISLATTETFSSGSDEVNKMPLVVMDHNSEICWQQFDIWSNIPQKLIDDLEKGARSSSLTNEVVRSVVSAMREVKTNLPCKAFKIIASRMVAKYTASFLAHDEANIVLGNGYETIYTKLLDRNNYLNRPNKKKCLLESPSPKKVKLMANARVGCPNWQPSLPTDNADEKKRLLKTIESNDPEFITLIKETFPLQRLFINNNIKTINQIYEEWPALFTEVGIFTHFEMLTKIRPFEIGLAEKSKRLILFGEQRKIAFPQNEDVVLSAIRITADHFKEDISLVIYQIKNVQFGSTLELLSPCIIEMENGDYAVQVEKRQTQPVNCFETAFLMCFALYFNFNLCYPKACACTFKFIQRYFFKIHQESGTKSIKNVKNKVHNFIKRLANLQ